MVRSPYDDALAMLARRELSAAQVRARLARRGHDAESIESAIARLMAAGAIDDARTAGAIARHETMRRRRGPFRVRQRLAAAGIATDVADRVLEEISGQLDADTLLAAAIDRRLAGRAVADERELARLYRHFTAQGFEGERVLRLLRARTASS
jgi:regulatory protein